jgi:tetratricopeptide (TPR) repeat protein
VAPPSSQLTAELTADDFFLRASAKHDRKDYEGAIADYTQAIRINPNYAEAYNNRGWVRNRAGDFQGAIADLNQVIRINPNDANAYFSRGLARSDLGDKQGVIADCQKAAQLAHVQGDTQFYQFAIANLRRLQR